MIRHPDHTGDYRGRSITVSSEGEQLNYRERATLRAVARGTAELTCSCEPDLFIDGLAFCDQSTAHGLVRRGLITPTHPGKHGERVTAQLTEAGMVAIGIAVPTWAA